MKFHKILIFLSLVVSLHASELRDDVLLKLVDDSTKTNSKIVLLQKTVRESQEKITDLESALKKIEDSLKQSLIKKEAVHIYSKKHLLANMKEEKIKIDPTVKKACNLMVTAWSLTERKEPKKDSDAVRFYKMGEVIQTYKFNDLWSRTKNGYIRTIHTAKLVNNSTIQVTARKNKINLRKTPYFSNNIVSSINREDVIVVYSILFNKDWYRLVNGTGYINKKVIILKKKEKDALRQN